MESNEEEEEGKGEESEEGGKELNEAMRSIMITEENEKETQEVTQKDSTEMITEGQEENLAKMGMPFRIPFPLLMGGIIQMTELESTPHRRSSMVDISEKIATSKASRKNTQKEKEIETPERLGDLALRNTGGEQKKAG